MITRFTTSIAIRAIAFLCLALTSHAVAAERITSSFSFPASIGDLSFDEVRKPDEEDRSEVVSHLG